MDNFIAIDFETANDCHSSVCSVGIAMMIGGELAGSFYSLIHPCPNFYGFYNTKVHGLRRSDTEHSPLFPRVWEQACAAICDVYGVENIDQLMALEPRRRRGRKPKIDKQTAALQALGAKVQEPIPFVAYNKNMDQDCLRKVFAVYDLEPRNYLFRCAYQAAVEQLTGLTPNLRLDGVAAYCGYNMEHHHNALDDAIACAYIARQLL